MNHFLVVSCLFFTIIFSGCSSYSSTKYFGKDDFYLKALQETKKADIVVNNEVNSIFTATYLNRVDKKYDNEFKNFIISLYSTTNNKIENPIFILNDEINYINIEKIEKDSELIKSIPLKNSWSNYYFVKFKVENSIKKLKLTFKNPEDLEAHLDF